MEPPFQPNKPEYRAIYEACYALCQLAGTELPNINTEPDWQIRKRGCDAIVKLQIAGIPTSAIIAQIEGEIASLIASLAPVAFSGNYNDLIDKPPLSGGTVTSVQLSVPGFFTVTSAPITTAGTIQAVLTPQVANLVLAGPSSGGAATPSFRSLVGADITLPTDKIFIGVGNIATPVTTSVYNIVAYGATTGSADNHAAIMAAYAACVAGGGGTIYAPEGTYITAELAISSSVGITFLFADRFSSIFKAKVNTAPVMTITGSNVTLKNCGFDGAYVSGATSGDAGIISLVNAQNIIIDNCLVQNGLRNAVRIYGDSKNCKVINSRLYRNYCGVRSFSNGATNKTPTAITVDSCEILSNWDRSGNDQTGGVKLEASSAVTMESTGHSITNCYIYSPGLLGIELWGGGGVMSNSTIIGNLVFGIDSADQFGISLNDCRQVSVVGNTVRQTNCFVGIEVANACQQCLVEGNNVNLFAANGTTRSTGCALGVFNNVGPGPKWTALRNNVVCGGEKAIQVQASAINTSVIGNQVRDFSDVMLYIQQADYTTVSHNRFEMSSGLSCSMFLYIDGTGRNMTDLDIGYNTFIGDSNFRDVFGYNNSTAFTLTNFHFHHNDGTACTFTGYDSWLLGWDAAELIKVRREDNYTFAGSGKADWPDWFSADWPTGSPFSPTIQEFSIPIASKFTFTVAANAGDQWFKVFSFDYGFPLTMAMHVNADFIPLDNQASSQTFWFGCSPYGQAAAIMKLPDGWYQGGSLKEIIYNNLADNSIHEIWLRFGATNGGTVTVGGADFASSWILVPSVVTTEPTWATNHYKLDTRNDQNALKSRYIQSDQLNIAASGYANFGTTRGTTGYGFRDNAGTMEVKNSGGSWAAFGTGGAGTVTSVGFTGGLISVANPTTTPAFTVAGTSGGIPYFSSVSAWASSALLAANALMIGGGTGVAPSTVTTGTGVLTALAANIGSAGAPVTFNGALGTPSSGTVTNLTGTASININGTVGATTPNTGDFTTLNAGTSVFGLGDTSKSISIGLAAPTTNTSHQLFVGAGGLLGQPSAGGEFDIGWNFYYNSGFKSRLNDVASRIAFNATSGETSFFHAPSPGAANAALTFTKVVAITNAVFKLTVPLQLDNAYSAGAVTPTGTLTVKDSSGTVYRIPCLV